MSTPLNVVTVAASPQQPSRTQALAEAILGEFAAHLPLAPHRVSLGDIARGLGAAQRRDELPESVERHLRAIENADLLIVAVPVYRGSYPGLFKHLFDLIDQDALIQTPVLLAATGGSSRHALVIEHQLRPLFGFFQALTLPLGVYGSESDFQDYQVSDDALRIRIRLAVERALPLFANGPQAARRIA
ncbi:FMN reductase [Phytopseudomonas dryadis]|uniref:FMN reductase n=1 Tax=Phytopseudomonas dryadis TaxID=2487520 RepID=A0A4Q9R048_9GAMM|nr:MULTISPECIES: FMN reductase [Pseudomonas]TBU90591.1 FMN reductase [Pseudomonas dryadis]TBV03765.1 FMN reductase [Pseudomonas dryadis]TBV15982.1 FMN reductase [Pseudomonas sp. FRB 230]